MTPLEVNVVGEVTVVLETPVVELVLVEYAVSVRVVARVIVYVSSPYVIVVGETRAVVRTLGLLVLVVANALVGQDVIVRVVALVMV